MKHYNVARFDEAIAEFEKAYDLDPHPTLLFNIARAHQQKGDAERALFFYKRYLQMAPKASDREDVENRVRNLEALMAQPKPAKKAERVPSPADLESPRAGRGTSPPSSTTAPAPPPSSAQDQPAGEVPIRASAPASKPPGASSARAVGMGFVIAGALCLGTGGVLRYVGNRKADAIDADAKAMRPYDPSNGNWSKYHGAATVSFLVGGASVVAGGVLLLLGRSDDSGAVAFGVGPTMDGAAFAAISGRF